MGHGLGLLPPDPNHDADAAAYDRGVTQRNSAGWEYHSRPSSPMVPPCSRAVKDVATGADYIGGPISDDLQQMRGIDFHLGAGSRRPTVVGRYR